MKNRSSLLPGFRFHPTDIELVMFYLKRKLLGKRLVPEVIADVNIYDFNPRDLPDKSNLRNGDLEWFFFCPKSRKYLSGSRTNRATETGFWKATGKDRAIKYKEKTVASIKTLVFHLGRPPKGERTDWVMHEYRMEDKDLANAGVVQDAYVLCRLFEKSGAGPKNGAQYGAPFEEEEWDDDDDDDLSGVTTETMLLKGSSSTLTNMTFTYPGPSTSTSFENARPLEIFTAPPAEFGATNTLVAYASTSAVTNVTLTEPGPSTATFSENESHLERCTVISSAPIGLCGTTTNGLIPYASSSAVMNVTSMEPGPSTKTLVPYASSSEKARCQLPSDDVMLTHADVASILHNNNAQDVEENRKGKKIMTDAPNDDGVIFLDSGDLLTLDDLSQDGFTMFQDDGFFDFTPHPFLADDLDADLGRFF